MCEILIGAGATLFGAVIGGVCSYWGNKNGAKENFELTKKMEIKKLKTQLEYLLDLYDKSNIDFCNQILSGKGSLDYLIWIDDTLIFYKDYKNGLLLSKLSAQEIQQVLKWFSFWGSINQGFHEKEYSSIVGNSLLKMFPKETESLGKLYEEIKRITISLE